MSELIELTITYSEQLEDLVTIAVNDFGINNYVLGGSMLTTGEKPASSITCYLDEPKKVSILEHFIEKRIEMSSLSGTVQFATTTVKEQDWKESWKSYWKPIVVADKLVVYPSWEKVDLKKDQLGVVLDTTMAFGTGNHETTRLALEFLLSRHSKTVSSFLDVGCGSGVLAVSAAKLGVKRVVGIDIEESIVETARNNSSMNKTNIEFSTTPVEQITEQFDLVAANIISSVLLKIWPALLKTIAPGGELIVSGILDSELEDFLVDIRLEPIEVKRENEWVALLLRRSD